MRMEMNKELLIGDVVTNSQIGWKPAIVVKDDPTGMGIFSGRWKLITSDGNIVWISMQAAQSFKILSRGHK